MATIVKRGEKWQAQVRRKGMATTSRTFHRKTDAEEWARNMEIKADRGDLPTPIRMLEQYTLRDILQRYKAEVSVKKRSGDNEGYLLDAFMRQPIAALPLPQLTYAHFTTYRDKRLKDVKPGTVNRELSIIRHALDIAEREWDVPLRHNPLAKLKKMKVNNARTRRLTEDEYPGSPYYDPSKRNQGENAIPLLPFRPPNPNIDPGMEIPYNPENGPKYRDT